jgi:aryl-alcohol dehydrogenase-like predicted oxidoreductase
MDLVVSGFAAQPLWGGGPPVGPIGLGTAELGMEYGTPGTPATRPSARTVARFVEAALERGVRFFDTARAYGVAEARLGRALGGRDGVVVATKAGLPPGVSGPAIERVLERSLRASLAALRMETVDVFQLHSVGADVIGREDVLAALARLKERGWLRVAGVTVYEAEAARRAIASGAYAVLQISVHPLDTTVEGLLREANAAGVGVVARSILLRGTLSPRAASLPERMAPLREAVLRLARATGTDLAGLPAIAYRWALGRPAVTVGLVGTFDLAELDAAMGAAAAGPLPAAATQAIAALPLVSRPMIDPRLWEAPVAPQAPAERRQ